VRRWGETLGRDAGERRWRDAGETLERRWRDAGETLERRWRDAALGDAALGDAGMTLERRRGLVNKRSVCKHCPFGGLR
jgi:hypothetical protein